MELTALYQAEQLLVGLGLPFNSIQYPRGITKKFQNPQDEESLNLEVDKHGKSQN